jgi:hypothetical protein
VQFVLVLRKMVMMKIRQSAASPLFILLSAGVIAQNLWLRITVPSFSKVVESFTTLPSVYEAFH